MDVQRKRTESDCGMSDDDNSAKEQDAGFVTKVFKQHCFPYLPYRYTNDTSLGSGLVALSANIEFAIILVLVTDFLAKLCVKAYVGTGDWYEALHCPTSLLLVIPMLVTFKISSIILRIYELALENKQLETETEPDRIYFDRRSDAVIAEARQLCRKIRSIKQVALTSQVIVMAVSLRMKWDDICVDEELTVERGLFILGITDFLLKFVMYCKYWAVFDCKRLYRRFNI
ncbi:Hypp3160 [Branchiostoma lanceolatum]|uniref:Hypp3160 protein n=1 Tax=Branchiostoma lanceolatum TaxID=7740 RepID=A0A8K0A059_BRALA|nr:Hypp3160 [Branchiostoma lanceolatum]